MNLRRQAWPTVAPGRRPTTDRITPTTDRKAWHMKDIRRTAHHRSRGPGRLAGLLMALLVVLGLSGSTAIAAPGGTAPQARAAVRVPDRAMDAVAAMQPSWNLGNTLDAIPDETSWGNPLVTRDLFKTIRAEGFRSVRIPVTWTDRHSATAPYTIDAAFMSRVEQVVDWALAEDRASHERNVVGQLVDRVEDDERDALRRQ
ncbi:cellulase family glycosylhydrolase [Streptomyces yerevanensis]|uniref:cellulase family glycosylhydrolase n=1 Tax=Streptomyces yerevanensis TaxID=66378 RepID=UPI0005245FF6